jgi:hypothetical protein
MKGWWKYYRIGATILAIVLGVLFAILFGVTSMKEYIIFITIFVLGFEFMFLYPAYEFYKKEGELFFKISYYTTIIGLVTGVIFASIQSTDVTQILLLDMVLGFYGMNIGIGVGGIVYALLIYPLKEKMTAWKIIRMIIAILLGVLVAIYFFYTFFGMSGRTDLA